MVCVDGDWNYVIAVLYAIFDRDIKTSRLRFGGRPVWYDRRIIPPEKHEEGFWHLTSRDELVYDRKQQRNVKTRVFDPRRSERLPWCKPTIENSGDPSVLVWDFEEAYGQVRTYVWLRELDYVVVLERQVKRLGTIFMIITAFFVDSKAKKRDLESRYANKQS
jgi:hypothetical protein